MQELTRRRTDDRFETWEIWYGDLQVGTIAQQDWDPNPERSGIWKWSCGFYPLHRDQCFRGQALDFETARAGFDAAWKVFLPKRTEAEFQASRRQKQWTANKYALWDAGYRNKLGRSNPVRMWRDVQSGHTRRDEGPYRTHHRKASGSVMDKTPACATSIR
jgi:hypothetical protein